MDLWELSFQRAGTITKKTAPKFYYLRELDVHQLCLISARTGRKGMWIPLAKELCLVGSRKGAFSAVAPALWNIMSLPLTGTLDGPNKPAFRKAMKTWL